MIRKADSLNLYPDIVAIYEITSTFYEYCSRSMLIFLSQSQNYFYKLGWIFSRLDMKLVQLTVCKNIKIHVNFKYSLNNFKMVMMTKIDVSVSEYVYFSRSM